MQVPPNTLGEAWGMWLSTEVLEHVWFPPAVHAYSASDSEVSPVSTCQYRACLFCAFTARIAASVQCFEQHNYLCLLFIAAPLRRGSQIDPPYCQEVDINILVWVK